MDRLDIAIALLEEAKEEKKRLEAMQKEIARIPKNLDVGVYWRLRREIDERYNPTPHKSVINDNIKTARRLLAREYI